MTVCLVAFFLEDLSGLVGVLFRAPRPAEPPFWPLAYKEIFSSGGEVFEPPEVRFGARVSDAELTAGGSGAAIFPAVCWDSLPSLAECDAKSLSMA